MKGVTQKVGEKTILNGDLEIGADVSSNKCRWNSLLGVNAATVNVSFERTVKS